MRQGKENGNSHHKYFITGNAYSPISPYKQGLYRTHLINLYENFLKKSRGRNRKKTLEREEDNALFSKVLYL